MRLSVVLPTYGKNDFRGTLDSLLSQTILPNEIIVVRNGTDEPAPTSNNSYVKQVNIVEAGLDLARNKGVQMASGEIISFIDDDALARKDWVESTIRAHETFKAPVIGGKIVPSWPNGGKPSWVKGILLDYLSVLDYSPTPIPVHQYDWVAGANLSFKRKVFDEVGLFDEGLDRKGDCLLSSGEEELCRRVRAKGHEIYYTPEMVVDHVIPSRRLTPNYFMQRAYWQGVSDLILDMKYLGKDIVQRKLDEVKGEVTLNGTKMEGNFELVQSMCRSSRALGYLQAWAWKELK